MLQICQRFEKTIISIACGIDCDINPEIYEMVESVTKVPRREMTNMKESVGEKWKAE